MTRKEALEYLKHRFMETGSPLNPSWESLEELKRHYGAIGSNFCTGTASAEATGL